MQFSTSSVGRQILMAVSGIFMLLFVIGHLLGNLTIFAGPDVINSYADKLHRLGPFLWAERLIMLAMLIIHVVFGILLTLENRTAKPDKYAVDRMLSATFAGRSMIWTGLLLLLFVVYHLLQFTFHVIPGVVTPTDAKGRFDVFAMVIAGLRSAPIALVYVATMVILFLHLSHGVQSIPQTLGWSNDRTRPRFEAAGKGLAWILLLSYCSIPVAILSGFLFR
jgi:succinate dehydrogenase / fumarate reductase, cytochrome b subunit